MEDGWSMGRGHGIGKREGSEERGIFPGADGSSRKATQMVYQSIGEGYIPLEPNTRVRLLTTIQPLELHAATGTVVGPAEYEDYYVVRLDVPAIYHEADGGVHDVELIRAGVDNLEVIEE
jgi:hypothetical protein